MVLAWEAAHLRHPCYMHSTAHLTLCRQLGRQQQAACSDRQVAEAKAKYCPSRVVRGIDFTRTGRYVEYDKPGSVADCCHACAMQQARADCGIMHRLMWRSRLSGKQG